MMFLGVCTSGPTMAKCTRGFVLCQMAMASTRNRMSLTGLSPAINKSTRWRDNGEVVERRKERKKERKKERERERREKETK